MADRYQDRPFPADDDYDRGGEPHASGRGESDPLAELARLIGQTDPFGTMGRANQQVQPPTSLDDRYDQYQPPVPEDDRPPAGPPPWMQRANRQEVPSPQEAPPDYPSAVHPLQRYAAGRAAPEPDYRPEAPDADSEPDPSRYDDALYGQLDGGDQELRQDPVYADDAYAYQDEYDDGAEEQARSVAAAWSPLRSCSRWRWWERAPPLPIVPMLDRRAAASRRSSRLTTRRPRSCRRLPTGMRSCRTAWRAAMAPRKSFRAKKRPLTSTPGPARHAWCFRR